MNEYNSLLAEVETEIGKAVVGKPLVIRRILTAILAGGHILMEDVPGVGKTTLAVAFSKVLGMEYKRTQFTPDVMPSDVVGFCVYDRNSGTQVYKPGNIMCNLYLADEINRTSSKTQSALLEVMEEGHVTIDGETHPVPNPFVVIATQNPVGAAGTQMLPDSQLDRFAVRLSMGYPDEESEIRMMKDRSDTNPIESLRPILTSDRLLEIRRQVEQVAVDDRIYQYVTSLVNQTRKQELLSLGVSPRGSLALLSMAKANAYLCGRNYVIPEDVSVIFIETIAHRIIPTSAAKMNHISTTEIAGRVLQSVEPPRIVAQ